MPVTIEKTTHTIDSPVGTLTLSATGEGLCELQWRGLDAEPLDQKISHPVLRAAALQLGEYFAGERRTFDLPLDLHGTDFQRTAWLALAEIPYGETTSYAEQARRIGRPTATRAVGAANGRNPVAIVLPCHRVIGANGALTGFAGGLDTKRFLLELEAKHAGTRLAGTI